MASLLRYAPATLSAEELVVLAQVTTELDAVSLRTQTKSSQEKARWANVLSQRGVNRSLIANLHVGGGESVRRAKRAAACLLLITDQPFAQLERALLQHTPENSAAGPIRAVASRTRDVIETVANICAFYGKPLHDRLSTSDLALELELGIPPGVLFIAEEAGDRLSRADYLRMLEFGCINWQVLASVGPVDLTRLIGEEKALWLSETAKRKATS